MDFESGRNFARLAPGGSTPDVGAALPAWMSAAIDNGGGGGGGGSGGSRSSWRSWMGDGSGAAAARAPTAADRAATEALRRAVTWSDSEALAAALTKREPPPPPRDPDGGESAEVNRARRVERRISNDDARCTDVIHSP